MKKHVLFFDDHGIFMDVDLFKLRVEFVKDLKLKADDEIILGGDCIDNYLISDFVKSDRNYFTILQEIDVFESMIREYKRVSKAKIVLIKGNHEIRHEKNMDNDHMKYYRDLKGMEFDEMYKVNKYNIKIVDDVYDMCDDFIVTHGESCGQFPARAELNKWLCSGASGHAHKADFATKTGRKGTYRWYSFGHLADKKLIDFSCKYSKKMLWNRSFGFARSENNKLIDLEVINCDSNEFYSHYLRKTYGKNIHPKKNS